MTKTTYRYWITCVKTSVVSGRPKYFNEEIEVDFEVKTADDIDKIVKILCNNVTFRDNISLTCWPHLLGITRDGNYRPYVTMVKLD